MAATTSIILMIPQETIQFKTFLKRTLVEALKNVFADHPDEHLSKTKIDVDFPHDEADYPAIVVRYFGRQIHNAGVGHREYVKNARPPHTIQTVSITDATDGTFTLSYGSATTDPITYDATGEEVKAALEALDTVGTDNVSVAKDGPYKITFLTLIKYKLETDDSELIGDNPLITVEDKTVDTWTKFAHYLYEGTVEFAIYGLSSLDRDLVSDSLVQILGMSEMKGWTNQLTNRIYHQNVSPEEVRDNRNRITTKGYSLYHSINLNTDRIQEFGESQVIAPWMPEDTLVYQTAHRVEASGEFYSLPPDQDYPLVERVDVFPWIEDIDEEAQGSDDPAPWMDSSDSFNYEDF